jgi:hypothetical protein
MLAGTGDIPHTTPAQDTAGTIAVTMAIGTQTEAIEVDTAGATIATDVVGMIVATAAT